MADDAIRDALDHIMRVARQGISPTKRLDWIEIRARLDRFRRLRYTLFTMIRQEQP